jgi:hypothetical protein
MKNLALAIAYEPPPLEGGPVNAPRLTKPLLAAMSAALSAALAGGGFEGGDFIGMEPRHFERALAWVNEQLKRRNDK